jgi:hypothetical protein
VLAHAPVNTASKDARPNRRSRISTSIPRNCESGATLEVGGTGLFQSDPRDALPESRGLVPAAANYPSRHRLVRVIQSKRMTDVASDAVGLAAAVEAALVQDRFERAVEDFVKFVRRVPDSDPLAWSDASLDSIGNAAEKVIEAIESRIDDGKDSQRTARHLAADVYAIRRALEEIHIWRRHFRGRAG